MEIATRFGEALLSRAIEALLDRTLDLLNYAPEGQVLDELKKWQRILTKIYAVLDDAEDKQMTNRWVNMWLSELRDLAYDVEDVLDDFATEVLRRKVKGVDPVADRPSKVQKLITTFSIGLNPSPMKFNADMMSKIKSITEKLDALMEQKNLLPLEEFVKGRATKGKEIFPLPTTSLVSEEKVFGREEDRKAVLDMLKAEASNAEQFSVVSIVGMGGMGKTTLAQLVFKDAALEFDLKAWISVGEDFNIHGMTTTLLHSLGEKPDNNNLNLLQVKLKEKLSGKKFLIVLDDLWTKCYSHWTAFSAPFEAGVRGSRIVVTTREQDVSKLMGAAQTYQLKLLSYGDCLSVFAKHALGTTDFDKHSDLKGMGEEIVKRCQGLPLAAKALGGVLRGQPRIEWEKIVNSRIWAEKTAAGFLPALRLSYYYLPSHLKQCFAYCALFPDDFEFDRNELVLLWMAEGFLQQPNNQQTKEELGYEYFDDLLSRSFFQESGGKKSVYVMHDLIRDVAQSVCAGICFNLDKLGRAESYTNVRHSSFTRKQLDISQRFLVFHEMKKLRTFIALPFTRSIYVQHSLSRNVLHDLVPKLTFLRVLSLSDYDLQELPNSIGALKHLRYLNLSYTNIQRLPLSFSKLFNLQTLKLCGCRFLVELPADIDNLVNLEHLDIRGTDKLQVMPFQISKLTNLCTLSKFIVGENEQLQLRELAKFPHLKGQLHIIGLQNVVKVQDAEVANLKEKRGIDNLELEWSAGSEVSQIEDDAMQVIQSPRPHPNIANLWSAGSEVSQIEDDAMQVMQSLRPHPNIANLSITSYGGTGFPPWLGDPSFNTMVQVQLDGCRKITSLPPLGQLPVLRDLSIRGMNEVKEVGAEFCGNGCPSSKTCFPSLETLRIEDMRGWKNWASCNHDVNEKFPKLRELTISDCSELVGKFPSCLPSLETLRISSCTELTDLPVRLPSLRELRIDNCGEELVKRVRDFTSLTTFEIRGIEGLVNLDEVLVNLVALESLSISWCGELKYLWQDGTDDVHNKLSSLKNLSIFGCDFTSLVEGENGLLPCNLQSLNIHNCRQLDKLPNGLHSLTTLHHLTIQGCDSLESLILHSLTTLHRLTIYDCDSLKSLILCRHNRDQTYHLEELQITLCRSLQSISIGEEFPTDSLKELSIGHCTTPLLDSLSDQLSHLTELCLDWCSKLESFPDRGLPIPSLMTLWIRNCENLRCLPNHMHRDLKSLRKLEISYCKSLTSFPEGGLPPNLIEFFIDYCENLTQPMSEWRLYTLTSLEQLQIHSSCPSTGLIVSFPDVDDGDQQLLPTSLIRLHIGGFQNLKCISRGIQQLNSLQELWISICPKLKSLPKEGFPATLGWLVITSCTPLKKRCLKEKGVFWPIIAHIPRVQIDDEGGIPYHASMARYHKLLSSIKKLLERERSVLAHHCPHPQGSN